MSQVHQVQSADGAIVRDPNNGLLYVVGTTVPTDTTAGYSAGCLFVDKNAAAGSQLYVNEGSNTSCDFNPLISGAVAESVTAARTMTAAQTVGASGSIIFSGTGYIEMLGSHRNRVAFMDDFLGDLLEDGWNQQADTGGTVALATVPGTSGTVTLTTDGTDDDTIMIAHELNWKASQGLVFECRLKTDVVTTLGLFVGLTDAKVETSPALPITRQTTVSVAEATDAVGFVFDTDSTSDTLFGSGVKAGTLIADQGASTAYAAGTYVTLRIEISTAGAASFYVDGTQIGATTADAVTTTVALTPYIGHANRGAFAHVTTVDYVYVSGARA